MACLTVDRYTRSAWYSVAKRWYKQKMHYSDECSMDVADYFANLGHNIAVAGALTAAEDRGWNRGQGEGFDAGVAHERHYSWARTQEDRW